MFMVLIAARGFRRLFMFIGDIVVDINIIIAGFIIYLLGKY